MQAMAMTEAEKLRFEMVEQRSIENERKINSVMLELDTLEKKVDSVLFILKGVAWGAGAGIVLTLLLLGFLTIKDVIGK